MRCENFALYHNKRLLRTDPCCRSAIKEFAHAFSCAYIELWINLGSLEGRSNISSNQEGSFQIFPLVTSSVNLAAFFIGKCLALCFVIVYQKKVHVFVGHNLAGFHATGQETLSFLIFKLIKNEL